MVFLGGSLVVLAIQRQGKDLGPGEVQLLTRRRAVDGRGLARPEETLAARDILVVESPELIRRQSVPRGRGSTAAMAILVAMVIMLATGAVPPAVAALLAAGDAVDRCAHDPPGLPRHLVVHRAADRRHDSRCPPPSPHRAQGKPSPTCWSRRWGAQSLILLLGLALITLVFGQLISNTATVLIMIPVALSPRRRPGSRRRPCS